MTDQPPTPETDPLQAAELADLQGIDPDGVPLDDYCILTTVTYLMSAADMADRKGISRQEAIDFVRDLYPIKGDDQANAEFLAELWSEHQPPDEDAENGWSVLSITAHGIQGEEISNAVVHGVQAMMMYYNHMVAPPYDQDDEDDE